MSKEANPPESGPEAASEAGPEAASEAEAYEEGTDHLEDVAMRRAVEGSDTLLIFLLKARRPDKYRDRREAEVNTDVLVKGAREKLQRKLERLLEAGALEEDALED